MRIFKLALCLAAALPLAACGDAHNVLFVTATQIGIGADSATQTANIGYDRHEGVISPVYDYGNAPPVFARLESDLSVLNPKIKQLYATGDAALIAVRRMAVPAAETLKTNPKTKREKKLMVFATGTNFGLQAAFRQEGVASMSLGYKRAEVSFIPLAPKTKPEEGDKYASVLAAIDIETNLNNVTSSNLKTSHFFATGDAAKSIAGRKDIYTLFRKSAEAGLTGEVGKYDRQDPNVERLMKFVDDGKATAKMDEVKKWIAENKITPEGSDKPTRVLNFITHTTYRDARKVAVKRFELEGN